LPSKEIRFDDIVFDPIVQTYCVTPNFKCPSYNHSWACPPVAPYLEQEISQYTKFYLVYVKFDFKQYIERIKAKHPKRSEDRIRNTFFMKNLLRDKLEQEIIQFNNRLSQCFKKIFILWDGFCRVCSNQKDKGCTYDSGDPCRYPTKRKYSMEAVGIDVTKTVKKINLNIEWPPINHAYRFGLICIK